MGSNILSLIVYKPQQGCESAIIKIDGRNFIDIVKEVELIVAQSTNEANLAGSYWYLPLHQVQSPSNFLLGGSLPSYLDYGDGKRSLLECTCQCEGCWPLRARVTTEGDYVNWSDFEQPHRDDWIYPESFQFIFSRTQLENAIKI